MEKIIFILGASGSGKTSNVKNIELKNPEKYNFCYFDQLGVPQEKEVFAKYGDWENWAIDRTNTLMNKIKNDDTKKITIFDIHTKPKNIEDACKNFDIENYHIIFYLIALMLSVKVD